MKAARLVGPREFEFVEMETPTLKPGEVIVRMEHVSICGTDLRTYDRVLAEQDYPLPIGRPCHECLGVIEESLEENFKPGQRVIAVTNAGGLVEYAAVPVELLVPVPDIGMDPALWVLCQPGGTVIYSCQLMGSVLGKRVVILSQGPIGLAFTQLIARQGASQVIVRDLLDYRLEMAKQAGATHTINAAREDVPKAVATITRGAMADVAVEAAGRRETAHQLFEVLRLQGLAVIFGLTHDEDIFPFDWRKMSSKLPRILVTNSAAAGERVECVRTCVDLVAQERLDFSHLVSHRLPFNDVSRAYELYSKKLDNSLKILINVG